MSQEEVVHKLTVSLSQAQSMVEMFIQCHLVPMIHGSPAIGKSAIVHALTEKHNLKLIDLRLSQCDPTDLLGFPQIKDGRAGYCPMETFPMEGDELPRRPINGDPNDPDSGRAYAGWLLFLDECNSASHEVQAACYKIILDRMVGVHNLHSKVAIVAAGNLDTDGAIVEQMSTAMQSRMAHIFVHVDKDEWVKWANQNQFDHRILSFIEFKPGLLYTFKPDHSDATYASPRTWDFTNRILSKIDIKDSKAIPMLSGCITEGITREFASYCDIVDKLPKIADIIIAPEQVRVSGEPSVLFAISGTIAHHANKTNIADLIKYIKRMPMEFQMVCVRMMIARTPSIMIESCMQKWVDAHAVELF